METDQAIVSKPPAPDDRDNAYIVSHAFKPDKGSRLYLKRCKQGGSASTNVFGNSGFRSLHVSQRVKDLEVDLFGYVESGLPPSLRRIVGTRRFERGPDDMPHSFLFAMCDLEDRRR